MSFRCLAIAVALAGSFTASGQPGFLVHFDGDQGGLNGGAQSVRELDGGYIIFCDQYSLNPWGRTHLFTRRIALDGSLIDVQEHFQGSTWTYDIGNIDPIATNGMGGFVAGVSEVRDLYDVDIWLVWIDSAGSIADSVELVDFVAEDSLFQIIRSVRSVSDGGFVLTGAFKEMGNSTRALLLRTDDHGDTLFYRLYGYANSLTESFGVAEMPDGGFALTGHWAMSTNQPNKSFLIRTDAQGNQIWRANYGEYGLQTGAVRVDADGYIYTWSAYREYDWPPWEWQQMMLCKWYPGGGQVWCKRSHYNNYVISYDLEILPDGSFITSGSSLGNGVLAKFSPAGDSLWSRTYSPTVGGGYLYDVQPTSDGGFIACGSADRYDPIDTTFQTNQVIWVVKTDSLGCVVPGCHTVGVQEYALDLNEYLHLAPNPVPRGQALRVVFEPPADLAPQGPLRVVVLDAQGKQVHQERMSACLPGQGTTLDLATNMLNSGLYYLHVVDATRWMAGAKLVVE